ncbi:hypothetical protein CXG81DRAFT_16727 [Caulochytrium protostelioides]|uniref:Uncharacterized protein n=1 Tax=Caulochytrium protostelioides TaxID=1555241 RepID=A0A4P9XE36_9FUNG|nr:hypothetical protein CXG81DRAFT_16727 [Caulochytrium protostelioides]|eukprot:RKP03758.1 hypothetical protein CXG81DRAFT_16727 [Caulochytrium protostelioides]
MPHPSHGFPHVRHDFWHILKLLMTTALGVAGGICVGAGFVRLLGEEGFDVYTYVPDDDDDDDDEGDADVKQPILSTPVNLTDDEEAEDAVREATAGGTRLGYFKLKLDYDWNDDNAESMAWLQRRRDRLLSLQDALNWTTATAFTESSLSPRHAAEVRLLRAFLNESLVLVELRMSELSGGSASVKDEC